jgi:hypothetical protein
VGAGRGQGWGGQVGWGPPDHGPCTTRLRVLLLLGWLHGARGLWRRLLLPCRVCRRHRGQARLQHALGYGLHWCLHGRWLLQDDGWLRLRHGLHDRHQLPVGPHDEDLLL